jgi:anti-sigma factor RsiW
MAVVPLNPDAHAKVQELLPWYASGRLDAVEQADVETHLAACPRCRQALDAERRLLAAHRTLDTASDVDRGFAALRERIHRPGEPTQQPRRRWRPPALSVWLGGLALAQLAVIAALAGLLFAQSPGGDYRLLGASGAPEASLVVKFRADATEADIRRAVRDSGARIADGPTASDAYLLSVPDGQAARAIERLRAHGAVTMAESLMPGSAQ